MLCFSVLRLTPLQRPALTILMDCDRNLNFSPFAACGQWLGREPERPPLPNPAFDGHVA